MAVSSGSTSALVARAAGPDRGVSRLERRRTGCDARGGLPRAALGSPEVRGHRSRALRRLPGDAAAWCRSRTVGRGKIEWPENSFFRARDPRGEPRRDPARRRRAELPLANVQRDRDRARTRPRSRARGDTRRAGRRRPAHAPVAGDGCRDRSAARRRARPPALALRGADGDRRRAARLVPACGDPVRQPVGRRASLRAARAEPARGEGALRAARGGALDRDRRDELDEAEEYVEQVSQAVATDADTASYVEELERRADSLDCSRSRTTSCRATRSRPRSRASCASGRRRRRRPESGGDG